MGHPLRGGPGLPKGAQVNTNSDTARLERALSSLVMRFGNRRIAADIADATGHRLPAGSWALLDYVHLLGPMRVSDIAALHGVEVSTVTPRLQSLESAGLIERHRDPADGRVSMIAIGPAGREALGVIHDARAELMARALPAEDLAALRPLVPIIERLSDQLQSLPPLREPTDEEESHP